MKLLLAVDSITTLNILLDEVVVRSWPDGTKAQVLSVVEDGEVQNDCFSAVFPPVWQRELTAV